MPLDTLDWPDRAPRLLFPIPPQPYMPKASSKKSKKHGKRKTEQIVHKNPEPENYGRTGGSVLIGHSVGVIARPYRPRVISGW